MKLTFFICKPHNILLLYEQSEFRISSLAFNVFAQVTNNLIVKLASSKMIFQRYRSDKLVTIFIDDEITTVKFQDWFTTLVIFPMLFFWRNYLVAIGSLKFIKSKNSLEYFLQILLVDDYLLLHHWQWMSAHELFFITN